MLIPDVDANVGVLKTACDLGHFRSFAVTKKLSHAFSQSRSTPGVTMPSLKTGATLWPGWLATVAVMLQNIEANCCPKSWEMKAKAELSDKKLARETGDDFIKVECRTCRRSGMTSGISEEVSMTRDDVGQGWSKGNSELFSEGVLRT